MRSSHRSRRGHSDCRELVLSSRREQQDRAILQTRHSETHTASCLKLPKLQRAECKYSIRTRHLDLKSQKLQVNYILSEELDLFLHF